MSQPKKGNKMVAKVVATTFATHFYMSQLWLQPSPKVATSIYNYNKLIVNAKKIKITNACSHSNHNIYLSTARKNILQIHQNVRLTILNYYRQQ